jgi:flagellar biosynthesis/type III secretory pathway protein FliH
MREAEEGYAGWLTETYGVGVDWALHAPHRRGDERNHHAHLMMTTRVLGPEGLGGKTRSLDDQVTGSIEIDRMREAWAQQCNGVLERASVAVRIDHRSLETQRAEALLRGDLEKAETLDRAPEQHLGVQVAGMERKAALEANGEARIGAIEAVVQNAERDGQPVTERGAVVLRLVVDNRHRDSLRQTQAEMLAAAAQAVLEQDRAATLETAYTLGYRFGRSNAPMPLIKDAVEAQLTPLLARIDEGTASEARKAYAEGRAQGRHEGEREQARDGQLERAEKQRLKAPGIHGDDPRVDWAWHRQHEAGKLRRRDAVRRYIPKDPRKADDLVPGLQWRTEGARLIYSKQGDDYFYETPRRIGGIREQDEAILAAMRLAHQKWESKPIYLTGNATFQKRAAELAGRVPGLTLADPKLDEIRVLSELEEVRNHYEKGLWWEPLKIGAPFDYPEHISPCFLRTKDRHPEALDYVGRMANRLAEEAYNNRDRLPLDQKIERVTKVLLSRRAQWADRFFREENPDQLLAAYDLKGADPDAMQKKINGLEYDHSRAERVYRETSKAMEQLEKAHPWRFRVEPVLARLGGLRGTEANDALYEGPKGNLAHQRRQAFATLTATEQVLPALKAEQELVAKIRDEGLKLRESLQEERSAARCLDALEQKAYEQRVPVQEVIERVVREHALGGEMYHSPHSVTNTKGVLKAIKTLGLEKEAAPILRAAAQIKERNHDGKDLIDVGGPVNSGNTWRNALSNPTRVREMIGGIQRETQEMCRSRGRGQGR